MVLLKCIAMMTVFYYPTHLYQWWYMLHISLLIYPMMQYSSTAPQTPSPKINQFVIGTQNKTMWLNEQCEYRINIAQGTGCDLHIKNLLFHQNGFCTITARSLLINWGNLLRKKKWDSTLKHTVDISSQSLHTVSYRTTSEWQVKVKHLETC